MLARSVLLALALVCGANVMLEVALTRLFSALMFYHFAFLSIAVALLGMGASGVYVYVSDRFERETALADMSVASRRFAAASIFAMVYVLANPVHVQVAMEGGEVTASNITLLQLGLLCGVAVLPFFFAGTVVSIAITHFREHVGRVYAWDLAGACVAALLVGPAIGVFGAQSLVVVCALVACVAALALEMSRANLVATGCVWLLYLVARSTSLLAMPSAKWFHADRVVFDRWNTFSHVTVESVRKESDDYDILIDAAARTPLAHARDATSKDWMIDVTALGYTFHPERERTALVIGPGGGIDVARALASGVAHVTAVDVNPLIATEIMRGQLEKQSGGLYRDPRVSVVVEDGRSWVRRTGERHDVIQLSMVDTWAATASGAFALTENTLYTLEAFQDYLAHLTNDGILSVSRWWSFMGGREAHRLALLAAGALEAEGIPASETRRHLYLASHAGFATLLVKKAPFTEEELAQLDATCARLGHRTEISATADGAKDLAAMIDAGAWSANVRDAPDDLTPPTDDRMFFFYFVKPGAMIHSAFSGRRMANPAVWILTALGAVLVAMTATFVILPLVLRRTTRISRHVPGLAYFAAIGLGFMVLEIALLQRLSLLLGHPSYALVVVLFGLLAGTAFGSRTSTYVRDPVRGAAVAAGVVAALAVIARFALASIVHGFVGAPMSLRFLVAGGIVAVFGIAMGPMMPLGVRALTRRDETIIPWAWGINGGMSVIGTVTATAIALGWGIGVTFWVGAALYAGAAALALSTARSSATA